MSSEGWAGPALAAVTERVGVIERAVGDRFPLYADPADGAWTTTGRGAWTGGFWAGLLWLRALRTRAASDRRAAACTARLEPWVGADTVTRGLILWYGTTLADGAPMPGDLGAGAFGTGGRGGAGAGTGTSTGAETGTGSDTRTGTGTGTGSEIGTGTEAALLLRDRAARALLADRDPALGIVPWGGAFGGPRLLARADGVPGAVPLLATVAPDAAADHLRHHLDLCLGAGADAGARTGARADTDARIGSGPEPVPAWRHDGATGLWRPCDEPRPGWSRGRAWLLLAVADALLRPGVTARAPGRFADAARRLLTLDGVLTGPLVPPADVHRPDGPLDTSAAAITAVALLKLARVPGERAGACADRAVAVLGELAGRHTADGALLDGCYDAGRGLAPRHELIWGDFFLALGLAALTGLVDLSHV